MLHCYIYVYIFTFSGFLIVAACVMTFEARDSATKIVPTAPQGPQKEQVNFLSFT